MPDLQIKADTKAVMTDSARFVADAITTTPDMTLALATGRTPLGMYAELVRLHRQEKLDFSRVRIFSLDEYVGLSDSDPRAFRNYLWTHFLGLVNVQPENVVLAPSSAGAGELEVYERAIRAAGGIALLIAGLGSNGHIAFNEPGSSFSSRTRVVDLADSTLAAMRTVFAEEELPKQAITMGIATILESRRILMLVAGQAKRDALARLHGPVTESLPASALQLHADVTIMADRAAVSG